MGADVIANLKGAFLFSACRIRTYSCCFSGVTAN